MFEIDCSRITERRKFYRLLQLLSSKRFIKGKSIWEIVRAIKIEKMIFK